MALWFITLTLTLTLEVLNPVDHSRTAAVHGCTNVACKERRRNGFVRLLQDTADAFESNRSLGTMHGVQVTLTLCLTLTTDPNPNLRSPAASRGCANWPNHGSIWQPALVL